MAITALKILSLQQTHTQYNPNWHCQLGLYCLLFFISI
nr:MAG TPA: Dynein light chain 1 (Dyn2), Dynein, Intermediate Chain, Light.9A [Caudoviricetes sp.]